MVSTNNTCYLNYSETYEARQAHRQSWIDFINHWSWNWFCTFTFRGDSVHPEKADKLFRVFISKINRALYGSRWYKHGQGVKWIRAIEMQRRGVIHYHALIGGVGVEDLRRLTYMDEWDDMAGYARIEPIDSAEAVIAYISKYVLKDGEIDLGGPLHDLDHPLLKDAGVLQVRPQEGIQGRRKPPVCEGLPGPALRASPGALS